MAKIARWGVLAPHEKIVRDDDAIIELVVLQLPLAKPDRPHGVKYRLYFGCAGKCSMRYDNEAGKGGHRHIRGREVPRRFLSLAKLRRDFESDI